MAKLQNKAKELLTSPMAKNIATLLSGSILAQALPVLVSPVLSRFYEPEEFGVFAIFMGVLGMTGVAITARYDLTIMLSNTTMQAIKRLGLSVVVAVLLSITLLILFQIIEPILLNSGIKSDLFPWMGSLILSALVFGIIQALNYLFNWQNLYRVISFGKLIQAGITATTSLALALISLKGIGNGLIIGYISGLMASLSLLLFFFYKRFYTYLYRLWKRYSFRRLTSQLKYLALEYKSYPMHAMPGALANAFALQAPVLFFAIVYSKETIGFFSMTSRVVQMPVILLSFTLSQVLFRLFADKSKVKSNTQRLLLKVSFILLAIPIPFVIAILIYGPDIFAYIFGSHWVISGEYAQILMLAFWIKFAVSPLSSIFAVKNSVKQGAIWQYAYLCSTLLVLVYGVLSTPTFKSLLLIYTINEIIIYIVYFIIIYRVSAKEA